MKVFRGIHRLKSIQKPVFLAAGFFDGMHRGHRKLIGMAKSAAKKAGGETWLFTFEEHPKRSIDPADAPKLLTSNRHRLLLAEQLGLDGCLLLQFDRRLSVISPQHFTEILKSNCPSLAGIFAGESWRFGHGGKGNIALLKKQGAALGFKVSAAKPVIYRNKLVSSTRIRDAVINGRLSEAAKMLGRPFSILGKVIKGRKIGRKLGYPTANLNTMNEILPPTGVYAVIVRMGDKVLKGVMNHGFRPTFPPSGAKAPIAEIHILSSKVPSLYSKEMEVFFVRKIRDEHKFTSAERLVERIEQDIKTAEMYLKGIRLN